MQVLGTSACPISAAMLSAVTPPSELPSDASDGSARCANSARTCLRLGLGLGLGLLGRVRCANKGCRVDIG